MISNDVRNIVFICDDNYVMPTAVAITSLICNIKDDDKYTIYILCDNVSSHNIVKLRSIESDNIELIVLDVDDTKLNNAKMPLKTHHVSKAAYIKYLIPEILKNENRVLYLDCDIIINSDISDIFNIDIFDCYGAVVSNGPKPHSKNRNIENEKKYYNSGVIFMNLERIRNDALVDKLIAYANSNCSSLVDQNGFNSLMKNVKYMSVINNFGLHILNEGSGYKEICEFYDMKCYKSIDELLKDVRILHYSSSIKPWKYYDCPFNEKWMKYYELSLFKNDYLERSSLLEKVRKKIYNSKSYKIGHFFVKLYHSIWRN